VSKTRPGAETDCAVPPRKAGGVCSRKAKGEAACGLVAGVGYGEGRYCRIALVGVVKGVGSGHVYGNAVGIRLFGVGGIVAGRKRQDEEGKDAIGYSP
jgi:hypothetical protein